MGSTNNLSAYEPNPQYVVGLSEHLQTKYFEYHEEAKQSVDEITVSFQFFIERHKKLYTKYIELLINHEKLKEINVQPTQPKISANLNEPSSEILGASPNCKLDKFTKIKTSNAINNDCLNQEVIDQKENINDLFQVFSSDFYSEMDDEAFLKHKSPPPTTVNTPEKVQSSPILSKRKRFNSKKNSSSTSNTPSPSVSSSNVSKISTLNTSNVLEININEIDEAFNKESQEEANKEPEKEIKKKIEDEFKKEPLKTIENTLSVTPKNNNTKVYNMLDVSTVNYGRTEFAEKGKKFRQSKLSFTKVIPVIDISKIDSQESLDNGKSESKSKAENSWDKTFFESDNTYTKKREDKNGHILDVEKESVNGREINKNKKSSIKDVDKSMKDNELIETSPPQSEKSKLRSKLSLKKAQIGKKQVKSDEISSETLSKFKEKSKNNFKQFKIKNTIHDMNKESHDYTENNVLEPITSKEDNIKNNFNAASSEKKSFELQRHLNDDTYFSPAEHANNRNELENDEIDMAEFQDKMKCKSPPAKRMLMDSYDMIPGRYEESPNYAYKEGAVRNKNQRAQLQGWYCYDCKKYYAHLSPEERQQQLNQCSRHRGKYNVNPGTPDSLFDLEIEGAYDSTCEE